MSNSIDGVLAQIRQASQYHQGGVTPKSDLLGDGGASGLTPSFDTSLALADKENLSVSHAGDVLKQGIDTVNQQQQRASSMAESFELGTGSHSLAEVMVQMQKADVSFKAMSEVRNKLVDAYREVMQMSV